MNIDVEPDMPYPIEYEITGEFCYAYYKTPRVGLVLLSSIRVRAMEADKDIRRQFLELNNSIIDLIDGGVPTSYVKDLKEQLTRQPSPIQRDDTDNEQEPGQELHKEAK